MGFWDRLLGREQFAQSSIGDPAFAAWWFGTDDSQEIVTPYTVLGLSAVLRAVSIISTTIAGLPLRTYERQGDQLVRLESDFDDPYPGPDGLTPFAWTETVLMHLLLWRNAFLWHEPRSDGGIVAYRPVIPDAITVKREGRARVFKYIDQTDPSTEKTVGPETITYIPGPSVDATQGHPLLWYARSIFSAAISGDKTAQRMLRKGVRIGGIVSPADGEDDWDADEMKGIEESIRARVMGSDNAGEVVGINRKLKLNNWTANNIEAQWDETRRYVLMEIEQLFGVPPHLIADTERQTSWGTGVAEQNLSLARYTLRGWSDRVEQVLSRRLPRGQFCEFDYKGLLQGTPADEVRLVIEQLNSGLISLDYATRVLNLPPPDANQQATLIERRLRAQPQEVP